MKENTKQAGLKYLLLEKAKQSKISHMNYTNLEIQEYLVVGTCNKNICKLIFKARSKTLDIKLQNKWKYENMLCIGCNTNEESGEEILSCKYLEESGEIRIMSYDWFFKSSVCDIVEVGINLSKRLKRRKKDIAYVA